VQCSVNKRSRDEKCELQFQKLFILYITVTMVSIKYVKFIYTLSSRFHCYHDHILITIPLLSQSHSCHDRIVITIPLLSRSHSCHDCILITIPLLSRSHSCHNRILITIPFLSRSYFRHDRSNFYEGSNGKISWLGLEPRHLGAELTYFPVLPLQDVHHLCLSASTAMRR
jgi:hypothetical protein